MQRGSALCLVLIAACGGQGRSSDPTDAPEGVDTAGASSLAVSPTSLDLGTVALGVTTQPISVTITFTGSAPAALTQMLDGPNASAFEIESSTCGATIAPAEACTSRVRFAPAMVGPSNATLLLAAGGATANVALLGGGTQQASLQISPSVHDFGAVTTNTTASRTFTVTNATNMRTGAIAVSLTGTDASQFSRSSDTCTGSMLNSSGTCTVNVTFTPASPGAKSASLHVTGMPGGSVTASLLGTGAAPTNSLVIAPAAFDFGTVSQGNSSLAKMFTITNTGLSSTGNLAITLAGDHPGDFIKQGDQCNGNALGPGASCTLFLTFEPGPVGARNARLQVAASPGGSNSADLTGTCVP